MILAESWWILLLQQRMCVVDLQACQQQGGLNWMQHLLLHMQQHVCKAAW